MLPITSVAPVLPVTPPLASPAAVSGGQASGGSFAKFLSDALNQVNNAQLAAQQADTNLAAGNTSDLANVMITNEKAELTIDMAVQVQNKVIAAYQQIMQMQV